MIYCAIEPSCYVTSRRLHLRCSGEYPCKHCQRSGRSCSYVLPSRKRGPPLRCSQNETVPKKGLISSSSGDEGLCSSACAATDKVTELKHEDTFHTCAEIVVSPPTAVNSVNMEALLFYVSIFMRT